MIVPFAQAVYLGKYAGLDTGKELLVVKKSIEFKGRGIAVIVSKASQDIEKIIRLN